MATVKKARSVSHPLEVMREVYALQYTEQRLRGITEGLRLAETDTSAVCLALRGVLRDSIVAHANDVADIADRLAGLLGRNAAKLQP